MLDVRHYLYALLYPSLRKENRVMYEEYVGSSIDAFPFTLLDVRILVILDMAATNPFTLQYLPGAAPG